MAQTQIQAGEWESFINRQRETDREGKIGFRNVLVIGRSYREAKSGLIRSQASM